ncbi:MAG: site-specific integrase [Pseudomonadales bacterium]|nr:site-specific integrase [Pseudomonadales bacterium]
MSVALASRRQRNIQETVSYDNYKFFPNDDIWQLNKNCKIRVSCIRSFEDYLRPSILETALYFAENRSAAHTRNLLVLLKSYQKNTNAKDFSLCEILQFKAYLGEEGEYKFGVLRVFIKQLNLLFPKIISEDVIEFFEKVKLKGNSKGWKVLSFDPQDGPFSDYEYEAIIAGIDDKFSDGTLTGEEYSLIALFAATGRRRLQIASLKVGDVRCDEETIGQMAFIVSVPRSKVHGGKFRGEFLDAALLDKYGQVLQEHCDRVVLRVESILNRELTTDDRAMLPVFTDYDAISIGDWKEGDEEFRKYLSGDYFHKTVENISASVQSTINKLGITSERTGLPLKANPHRFRYTVGTRAAREGAGSLLIATLLDHSDMQNVDVYINSVPEYAKEISEVMNSHLTQYVAAFQGEIVKNEEEALSENPNASRIRTEDALDNIGSCGTNAMCSKYAPVACYLCEKFRPWRDAPHHLVLKHLEEERNSLFNDDPAIASINDRAIQAVLQVIVRCNEEVALTGDSL